MPTAIVDTAAVVNGINYKKTATVTGDSLIQSSPSLTAAKIGSLTTRTSDTAGTLTMNSGHGITTSAIIDIYWSGGSRHDVVVGTVATNSVPFSGGIGDNLPAAATEVTAMVVNDENFAFVANNSKLIAIQAPSDYAMRFAFLDGGGAVISGSHRKLAAGEGFVYHLSTDPAITNPIAGSTVAKVRTTHGDSALTHRGSVVVLFT